MDLTYVKEFTVMSEICNYTEAADELFISQSSLYKHIKALETELGVVLFVKDGKHIKLTKYGQMFVPYARRLLEIERDFLADIEDEKQEETSIIVLGTAYRVTDLVRDFRKKYGDNCMIRERKGNAELMKDDTDCDLLMACNLDKSSKYERMLFCHEELVVMLPKTHPLANRKSIKVEELKREKFVMIASLAEGKDMGAQYLEDHNIIPRVAMNGITGTEVARLVSEGVGISILNRRSIERAMPDQVAMVSLEPKVEFDVELCWRKDRKLSDMALKFIEFTSEYVQENFNHSEME